MLLKDSKTNSLQSKALRLFHFFIVKLSLYVLENHCFERIPFLYQAKIQFVDQFTRKTFSWSIHAPCKTKNFDQQISLDQYGDESLRLTPYPIKVRNPVTIFTLDEVENHFNDSDLTAQKHLIYSQRD